MTIAVQVRGLRKSYMAGVGSCLAAVEVLRGIELTVHVGEAIAIVGPAGSGKSTLLLCIAGLLSPDAGDIAWFDNDERAFALRRVRYHLTRADLLRAGACGQSHVHLLDLHADDVHHIAAWTDARRDQGDAVIIAARDAVVGDCVDRHCFLHGGFLRATGGLASRVAEPSQ